MEEWQTRVLTDISTERSRRGAAPALSSLSARAVSPLQRFNQLCHCTRNSATEQICQSSFRPGRVAVNMQIDVLGIIQCPRKNRVGRCLTSS